MLLSTGHGCKFSSRHRYECRIYEFRDASLDCPGGVGLWNDEFSKPIVRGLPARKSPKTITPRNKAGNPGLGWCDISAQWGGARESREIDSDPDGSG
jgi:hypothetical protein